jgi:hypothetical protein
MENLAQEFEDSLVLSGYTPEMAEALAKHMVSTLEGLTRLKEEHEGKK